MLLSFFPNVEGSRIYTGGKLNLLQLVHLPEKSSFFRFPILG